MSEEIKHPKRQMKTRWKYWNGMVDWLIRIRAYGKHRLIIE